MVYRTFPAVGYDAKGRQTSYQYGNPVTTEYNILDLPQRIASEMEMSADYMYDADGRKLLEVVSTSTYMTHRDYVGEFIYLNGSLKTILFDGGYVDMSGATPTFMFFLKDHLGSVRAVISESGTVIRRNDYYPYGDLFEEMAADPEGSTNRLLFTGKELCPETGLHDFGARFLNTRLGRFTTLDPLAEKYPNISPYAYCNCNPVNFVDPDGMESWRLDRSGYLHKTEGNDNRIYATDRDGNQSTDYLEISNADIVDSLSNTKEFVRGNGKKVQISSVVSKSDIDDLFKIFLFAANNTDVEWALHRGQDNNYLLGTSHHKDSVDDYTILAGDDNAPLPISSVHSHPNTLDVLTMGYHIDTYYGSDQWKVNNNQASRYNYVYFPKSTSLYLAGEYNPVYIKHIRIYNNFYFGTLNHK